MLEEVVPILDSCDHCTSVDEVERVVENPFARAVIDQKLTVWWHLFRLDRT